MKFYDKIINDNEIENDFAIDHLKMSSESQKVIINIILSFDNLIFINLMMSTYKFVFNADEIN